MRMMVCFIAVVGFVGCGAALPTAPSELTTGLVVYKDANFLGESFHVTKDISDLRAFGGACSGTGYSYTTGNTTTTSSSWNDCISSVRVAPGWVATLYRDDDYRDDSVTVTTELPNLQLVPHDCPHDGLNDCVSSIRISKRLPPL